MSTIYVDKKGSDNNDGTEKSPYLTIQKAVDQAIQFVKAGVDILDIGGESTRPGAEIIDAEEEMKRIVPIIEAVSTKLPDIIISVDTYKSPVAESAIKDVTWGRALDLVRSNIVIPGSLQQLVRAGWIGGLNVDEFIRYLSFAGISSNCLLRAAEMDNDDESFSVEDVQKAIMALGIGVYYRRKRKPA